MTRVSNLLLTSRAPLTRTGLAAVMLSTIATAQRYVITELPPNGPYGAFAWDLNDAGVAVGDNLTTSLQRHALAWPAAGGVVDLTPGNALAKAQGISQGGIVAGWLQNTGTTQAATWTQGAPSLLGWLPGHVGSLASGTNDAGLVCGWSVHPVGDPFAVVWQNGQVLAIAGAHSWAFAVSETGDVVGRRWVGTAIEAFRWRAGQTIVLPDLGPDHAQATGTSPAGLVAGCAEDSSGLLRGIVWDQSGALHDLGLYTSPAGPLTTQATDVADDGTAVGAALVDPIAEIWTAVVWRGNGAEALDDLIPAGSGWTLFQAQAVNARGEIAGFGLRAGAAGARSCCGPTATATVSATSTRSRTAPRSTRTATASTTRASTASRASASRGPGTSRCRCAATRSSRPATPRRCSSRVRRPRRRSCSPWAS